MMNNYLEMVSSKNREYIENNKIELSTRQKIQIINEYTKYSDERADLYYALSREIINKEETEIKFILEEYSNNFHATYESFKSKDFEDVTECFSITYFLLDSDSKLVYSFYRTSELWDCIMDIFINNNGFSGEFSIVKHYSFDSLRTIEEKLEFIKPKKDAVTYHVINFYKDSFLYRELYKEDKLLLS